MKMSRGFFMPDNQKRAEAVVQGERKPEEKERTRFSQKEMRTEN